MQTFFESSPVLREETYSQYDSYKGLHAISSELADDLSYAGMSEASAGFAQLAVVEQIMGLKGCFPTETPMLTPDFNVYGSTFLPACLSDGVFSLATQNFENALLTCQPNQQKDPECTITYREATVDDVEDIIAMRSRIDMTGAFALVWDAEEMRERIHDRNPMLIVAVAATPLPHGNGSVTTIVGVGGMDVRGMDEITVEENRVKSVGSRLIGAGAAAYQRMKQKKRDREAGRCVSPSEEADVPYVALGESYAFPASYCMCRGMLVHPDYRGMGIASNLHKARLQILAHVAPETPGVLIGARSNCPFDESDAFMAPLLEGYPYPKQEGTPRRPTMEGDTDSEAEGDHSPAIAKNEMMAITYASAHSIVHMVHERGWKFAGYAYSDGGPVWMADKPICELVKDYDVPVILKH